MNKLLEKYIGQKFGSLLVTSFVEKRKDGNYFQCKCDCGNNPIIRISALYMKNGQRKCRLCYKGATHPCWRGYGDISHDYFTTIKCSSKRKKLNFNLTIKYLWDLFIKQNKQCALTGIPLEFAMRFREKTKTTASLDRIDNNKGYIIGNVRWLHKAINHIKCNIPDDLFYFICEKVSRNHANPISEEDFLIRCRSLIKTNQR